jgi:hypothetical protein
MDSDEERMGYVESNPDIRVETADHHRDAEILAERFRQMAAQSATSWKPQIRPEDLKWAMERPPRQYPAFADSNRDARLYSIRVKVS